MLIAFLLRVVLALVCLLFEGATGETGKFEWAKHRQVKELLLFSRLLPFQLLTGSHQEVISSVLEACDRT